MSGKHLKELRMQLGLSQLELAGPEMTRNLLSMIENDRAPLTLKTAEVLSNRINTLFRDDTRFEPVTAEDLYIPHRYQARMEIKGLLSTIAEFRFDNHFNINLYLTRISALFSQWDLPKEKTQAYLLIATYFEDAGKNQEAHLYFSRAYENAARSEDPTQLAQTALSLSRTALKLEHYQSAILSAEALRSYEGRIPDLLLLEVFLNQAVAYMADEDYESALGSLIFCEHLVPKEPPRWQNQLLTMKIDCYISKGMLGIARRLMAALDKQVTVSKTHDAEALRITQTCLKGRMDHLSLTSEALQGLWEDFTIAPANYPHFEQLFLRLMESTLLAECPELFEKIAWRAITDISPKTHPVSYRNTMEMILKAWSAYPDLNLEPHWKYFLRNEDNQWAPSFSGLILTFITFFEGSGRHGLTTDALKQYRSLKKA